MINKVEFIAFSDLHMEDWKRFSENHSRLKHCGLALKKIRAAADEHKCSNILFTGDWFDNPKEISNLTGTQSFKWVKKIFDGLQVFAISGNHDQCEMNTPTNKSPSHLDLYNSAFDNFNLLDYKTAVVGGYKIQGVPYLKNNVGFVNAVERARKEIDSNKKNILLVHTDFPNIHYTQTRVSDNIENLPKRISALFRGFDLVLSGHIHYPQKIRANIIMLGATHHQKISDMGIEMGYWLLYTDLTYKFCPLDLPQFRYLDTPGKIDDFYIPQPDAEVVDGGETKPKKSEFVSLDSIKLTKAYLKAKNITDPEKFRLLGHYLQVERP